jgi:hypothetical protein
MACAALMSLGMVACEGGTATDDGFDDGTTTQDGGTMDDGMGGEPMDDGMGGVDDGTGDL